MFKFEGGQTVYIPGGHAVKVIARTEFFNGKQPRYCVESDTHMPGKNMAQDWINEDRLTDTPPPAPVVEEDAKPEVASLTKGKKLGGIRKHGLGNA